MHRLLIASDNKQAFRHSRTGALLRYIQAAAQMNLEVCDTLRYLPGYGEPL
jgi:hypothetical protein